MAVLLNIDNDHLDFFGTMERLCESFKKFVDMAHTAVINGDDPLCRKIADSFEGKCYTFGKEENNDYVAKNITPDKSGMKFDLYKNGEFAISVSLGIPGEHNVYNALAAFASADICNIDHTAIVNAIAAFSGAGRRFEKLGTYNGIAVADDYAHHPTELTATLTAAKNMGYNNVIAVFQPFTFSRTELLKDEFIKALSIADKVVLTPIMGSREVNKTGISSNDLAKGLDCAYVVENFEETAETLCKIAKDGDLVITMGGGDIYKAARMFIERIK
jgi:UDP-N-acetylmuramate--alanine ligase